MIYLPCTILFFSFAFRHILVLYPDRGLISKGKSNLKLFHQLYWVIVSAYILLFCFLMPISHIIRGNFPKSAEKGKICLLLQTDNRTTNKGLLIELAFYFLIFCQMFDFNRRTRRFMRGLCPTERNSCIRKYRRNLINMKETLSYDMSWYMIIFLEHMSVLIFSKIELDPMVVFLAYNILVFILYFSQHIYFINHFLLSYTELLSKTKGIPQSSYFGSNQQVLQPRRPPASSSVFDNSPSLSPQSHHVDNYQPPNFPTIKLHCSSPLHPRANLPNSPSPRSGFFSYPGLKQFPSSANSPKPTSNAPCSPRRGLYNYIGLGQCNSTAHSSANHLLAPSHHKRGRFSYIGLNNLNNPANSLVFPFNGLPPLPTGRKTYRYIGFGQKRSIVPLQLPKNTKSTMPDVE